MTTTPTRYPLPYSRAAPCRHGASSASLEGLGAPRRVFTMGQPAAEMVSLLRRRAGASRSSSSLATAAFNRNRPHVLSAGRPPRGCTVLIRPTRVGVAVPVRPGRRSIVRLVSHDCSRRPIPSREVCQTPDGMVSSKGYTDSQTGSETRRCASRVVTKWSPRIVSKTDVSETRVIGLAGTVHQADTLRGSEPSGPLALTSPRRVPTGSARARRPHRRSGLSPCES
jgi:hypothetical protein